MLKPCFTDEDPKAANAIAKPNMAANIRSVIDASPLGSYMVSRRLLSALQRIHLIRDTTVSEKLYYVLSAHQETLCWDSSLNFSFSTGILAYIIHLANDLPRFTTPFGKDVLSIQRP